VVLPQDATHAGMKQARRREVVGPAFVPLHQVARKLMHIYG